MKASRFEKDGFGGYHVIDNRNGEVVKRNISKISRAAAYVDYYQEEIDKAEKKWSEIWK